MDNPEPIKKMAQFQTFPSSRPRAVFQSEFKQIPNEVGHYVAINYITVRDPNYLKRFTELFATRAGAIDGIPGFLGMHLLEPQNQTNDPIKSTQTYDPETGIKDSTAPVYLVVTHWRDEKSFQNWTRSAQFIEGHRRGFADVANARALGKMNPMSSDMKTYTIIST